jgi:hypothetical protein
VADALRRVPQSLVAIRLAEAALDLPVDKARIRAEVHVVPEITVREDVEEPPADDAHKQAREPEIDDDVRIFPDAPRPDRPHRRRKQKAREEQYKIGRE